MQGANLAVKLFTNAKDQKLQFSVKSQPKK